MVITSRSATHMFIRVVRIKAKGTIYKDSIAIVCVTSVKFPFVEIPFSLK
jgi:hypothetical protein